MASTIKLKNGSGAPTSGQLVQGEPALDLTNKRLYTENASGTVIEVGTNPSSLTTASADINGGTIDGTVIGGTTAAAGTFTSITGTSANINGTVTADGLTVDGSVEINTNNVNHTGLTPTYHLLESDVTNENTQFLQAGGTFRIRTVNDDTSNPIERLRIDHGTGDLLLFENTGTTAKFFWDASSESLGIGTTSPQDELHVRGGVGALSLERSGTAFDGTFRFVAGGLTGGGLRIVDDTLGTDLTRVTIDSSGNLLVGKTSTDFGVVGTIVEAGGNLGITRTSAAALNVNRLTTDGDIAKFYKDGTTVGSIGTNSGLFIGSTYGNDAGIRFASDIIAPSTTTGANRDAAIDLGYSSSRFKDLYLSGGVYLGGTGAANLLDDYETGTWTPEIVGSTTAGSYSSTIKIGTYTKVGQLVTVWGYFLGSSGTGAGDLNISGLPFSLATDSVGVIQGNAGLVYPSGTVDACLFGSAGTTLHVRCNRSDGTTYSKMLYPTTANYIRFTLSYRTA